VVRERPELKCLSKGRKRNQNEIPLVTTSERGVVQTEKCKKNALCGVEGSVSARILEYVLVEISWKANTEERDSRVGKNTCREIYRIPE